MDDIAIARALHVVAVVAWIGGVTFVTLVVMPAISASIRPDARLAEFHRIEGRFAWQARIWVLLAGMTGFWMAWRADLWSRFSDPGYWWMHAMVAVWAIFALMLFVLEPLVIHRRMARSPFPAADFRRMEWMHRLLTVFSLITAFGAVAGSHGLFF